jgi:hypothetical protein
MSSKGGGPRNEKERALEACAVLEGLAGLEHRAREAGLGESQVEAIKAAKDSVDNKISSDPDISRYVYQE